VLLELLLPRGPLPPHALGLAVDNGIMGTIWPGTKEIDAYGRWTGRVYNAMGCQWTDSPMYPGTDRGRLNLDRQIQHCPTPTATPEPPPMHGPKLPPQTSPCFAKVCGCFEGRIEVSQVGLVKEAHGPDLEPKILGTTQEELKEAVPGLINRLRNWEAPAVTLRTRSFAELHADDATATHLIAELRRALERGLAPDFGIHFFGLRHNVKSTEQRYELRIFPLYR